jgi:hypothetical protein
VVAHFDRLGALPEGAAGGDRARRARGWRDLRDRPQEADQRDGGDTDPRQRDGCGVLSACSGGRSRAGAKPSPSGCSRVTWSSARSPRAVTSLRGWRRRLLAPRGAGDVKAVPALRSERRGRRRPHRLSCRARKSAGTGANNASRSSTVVVRTKLITPVMRTPLDDEQLSVRRIPRTLLRGRSVDPELVE